MIDTKPTTGRPLVVRLRRSCDLFVVTTCLIALLVVSCAFGQNAENSSTPKGYSSILPADVTDSRQASKQEERTGYSLSNLVALVSLGISVMSFFYSYHQTKTVKEQFAQTLMARIYELNRAVVEHPHIPRFLYDHATDSAPFFIATTPHDDLYFQVRSAIYFQLNFFDELCNVFVQDNAMNTVLERQAWESYIVHKMRHPLFKELVLKQRNHWGKTFNQFIDEHLEEIEKPMSLEDRELY